MSVVLVDLYNQALSKAGTRSRLVTVNDVKREAELCNLWYPTVRDIILKAFWWPTARTLIQLTTRTEQPADGTWVDYGPPPQWQYAYTLPTNYLYPRYISTFEPFETGQIADVKMLFTNAYNPIFEYTKRLTDQLDSDIQLYNAIINGLAAYITEPLSGRGATANAMLQQANGIILEARLAAANEKQTEYEHIPDWLAVRGFMSVSNPSRFFWPVGPLLGTSL
jgi:hypothetical protein